VAVVVGRGGNKLILGLRDIYEAVWLDVIQQAYEAGRLVTLEAIILRRSVGLGALSWTITCSNPQGK